MHWLTYFTPISMIFRIISLKRRVINIIIIGSVSEVTEAKGKDIDIKIKNLLSKTELINFDLFLDSLAISSTFIKFSERYDEVEKVILFLV